MSSRTGISFLLIVSALVMMPLISMSQNRSIDSLQQLLKSTKQDTSRVNILNKLSEEYDNNMSLDTAYKYANTALSLAKKISNLKGIAKALDNMGNVLSDQGKNDEALVKYLTSLGIKKEIGNKKELAYTYNLIGNIATNNDEALKNYSAA